MLSFEKPIFLLALFLPYFFFILKKKRFIKKRILGFTLFDSGEKLPKKAPKLREIFLCFSFVFLVFASSLPIWITYEKNDGENKNQIIFVLDISPSMQAMDENGATRLSAAKNALKFLLSEIRGGEKGLVLMGSEAALACAPTGNTDFFFEVLEKAKCGDFGEETAIGESLSLALYHLQSKDADKKCVVLLTDGENNSGAISLQGAVSLLKNSRLPLFVVTFGQEGSAPIEYVANDGKKYSGFIQSSCDYENLRALSKTTGGDLFDYAKIDELSFILKLYSKGAVARNSRFVHEKKGFEKLFVLLSAFFSAFAVFFQKFRFKKTSPL